MRNFSAIAAGVACMALSLSAAGETRHADAHVHGAGHMNFAVEGKQVHLELETPGFDILGFETITSEKQHKLLDQAVEQLKAGDLWVFTPSAGCQLKEVEVSAGDDDHDDHDKHDGHDKHDDGHDRHDDDHDKHEDHAGEKHHDEKHEQHVDEEGGHMDIAATYVYQCTNISKLTSISTNLFKRFEHSEQLKVQGITDRGQVSGMMTRKQPEVRF